VNEHLQTVNEHLHSVKHRSEPVNWRARRSNLAFWLIAGGLETSVADCSLTGDICSLYNSLIRISNKDRSIPSSLRKWKKTMQTKLTKITCRAILTFASLVLLAGAAQSQSLSSVNGRWEWKEVARKHKPQTQFSIVIRRSGNAVSGTYSVDDFIDGKWQGEDGNQTPFIGRIKGKTIRIEFDPAATVPGYQENVTYHPPADGRPASVGVLTLNGQTLLWQFVSGAKLEDVPSRLTLHRERSRK
jgi:hypothetical protein